MPSTSNIENRRVVFHPGAPKCATTYIQNVVSANAHGVVCLGRPNHSVDEYQKFKRALIEAEKYEDIKFSFDSLINTISEKDVEKIIFISDETIFNVRSHMAIAERMRHCSDNVDVIITTRDQRTALLSLYKRHDFSLKNVPEPYIGRHVDFENWMQHVMRKGEPRFNFWKAYQGYSGVFGSDRVHVVPFELLQRDPDQYWADFSSILGVQKFEPGQPSRKSLNPAHSARLLRYQKIRSRFLYGMSLTKFLPGGALLRRLNDSYLQGGAAEPTKLIESHVDWMRSVYGHGNRSLAEATGNRCIENYLVT